MRFRLGSAALILLAAPVGAAEIESRRIGLTADLEAIEALSVDAGVADAGTVALIGGLAGDDASSRAIREHVESYANRPDAERRFALIAVPVANPAGQTLGFPPTGAAFRENAESHVLWRWLGLQGPDQILIVGTDLAGLENALETEAVGGVAPIPAARLDIDADFLSAVTVPLELSAAHRELERRLARTPLQLARELEPIYSQSFNTLYIDGMGLIAHLGLGNLDHVERAVAPYVDGTEDSLGGRFGVSTLVLAGHLVFAELAERTGDERYLERARAAADLSFDDDGELLEAVPGHGEMSDAIFMGASILAAVGDLTHEQRYFDMAARQIDFMNALVRRDDGLYRHSPLTEAAWGRGNGFAAIGYALTLSKLPESHAAYPRLLTEYRDLMSTLAAWQNEDGTWRQVVDQPGAYHETSSTAIIGFSIQRGLNRGWLDGAAFDDVAERAFLAVSMRTDAAGGFINVSESTNKQPSLEAYLHREALHGRDQRTGSFAMLFAVERANPAFAYDRGNGLQARQDPRFAEVTAQCRIAPEPASTPNRPPTPQPSLNELPATAAIPGVVAAGQRWTDVWNWEGNNVDGIIAGDDGTLWFANNDASNVMRFDTATGRALVVHDDTNTGGALSRSADGALFVASRGVGGGVLQLEPERRMFADSYDGEPLDCLGATLNDLAADSRGGVYMTISGAGLFYANADGEITQYGNAMSGVNGIVLSPDERTLYVTNGPPIVAFDVAPDGSLTNQRVFAELQEGRGDGSAVDQEGRVYVSNGAGVEVFSPDGEFLGSITGPRGLHGVAFGGPEKQTLYGIVFYGGWGTPSARNQIIAMPLLARGYAGRAK